MNLVRATRTGSPARVAADVERGGRREWPPGVRGWGTAVATILVAEVALSGLHSFILPNRSGIERFDEGLDALSHE